MKIEIDTNKDSREDIKKAIKMIQALVGEESNSYSSYDSNSTSKQPEPFQGVFNMFRDDTPVMGSKTGIDLDEDDDFKQTTIKESQKEKKEPKIQIIEY